MAPLGPVRLTCPMCHGAFNQAHGHAKRHIAGCDGSERARSGRGGRRPKPPLSDAECKLATQILAAPRGQPRGWKAAAAAVTQLRAIAHPDVDVGQLRVSARWLSRALQSHAAAAVLVVA